MDGAHLLNPNIRKNVMLATDPRVIRINAVTSAQRAAHCAVALAEKFGRSAPTGAILWQGPSRLGGGEVAVVGTFESGNTKTGDAGQIWVLPTTGSTTGQRSSCGDCPFRRGADVAALGDKEGGGCYVDPRTLSGIARSLAGGRYPVMTPRDWARTVRVARLGAFGEMSAAPVWVTAELCGGLEAHTGFLHSWKEFPEFRRYLMASVETEREALQAWSMGWRTYRVTESATVPRLPGELVCPYDRTGLQCIPCNACSGMGGDRRSNIIGPAHGIGVRKVIRILQAKTRSGL
jgi:hypothetical protein